jgi:ADP-ribose pyrophosphatase
MSLLIKAYPTVLDAEMEQSGMVRRIIYSGSVLRLASYSVNLCGRSFTEEVVEHPGAVAILPLKENDDIVLVRQFRPAIGKMLLELPAGTRKKGEDEAECAARELAEETGYSSGDLKKVFELYLAPGYSSERMGFFVARRLKPLRHVKRDPTEAIETLTVDLKDALEMVESGEISDAKTIIGVLYLALGIRRRGRRSKITRHP